MPARAEHIFYLHKHFYIMRSHDKNIERVPGFGEEISDIALFQELQEVERNKMAIQTILNL